MVHFNTVIYCSLTLFTCALLQAYVIHSHFLSLMLQGCATFVHSQVRWRKWMSLVCCFDFCLLFSPSHILLIALLSLFFIVSSSYYSHKPYTGILFAGHAKLMVSLLQDIQASDQRSTMLQLVEKMKTKQKEIGWSVLLSVFYLVRCILFCQVSRFLGLIVLHSGFFLPANVFYVRVKGLLKSPTLKRILSQYMFFI